MNPNNQPTSSDYLDQIAPKPQRKFDFLLKNSILVKVLLGFTIITAILVVITSFITPGTGSLEHLGARLTATKGISEDATTKLKSSQLRALNSSLNSFLTNSIRDLTPLLAKKGIKIDKIDAKITTAESNAEILSTLEDARLNAIYDRTYAREMAYQLETTMALLQEIYDSSNNSELKKVLDSTYSNISDIQKQLSEFNS